MRISGPVLDIYDFLNSSPVVGKLLARSQCHWYWFLFYLFNLLIFFCPKTLSFPEPSFSSSMCRKKLAGSGNEYFATGHLSMRTNNQWLQETSPPPPSGYNGARRHHIHFTGVNQLWWIINKTTLRKKLWQSRERAVREKELKTRNCSRYKSYTKNSKIHRHFPKSAAFVDKKLNVLPVDE